MESVATIRPHPYGITRRAFRALEILRQHPGEDGPAILLCPELIATLYPRLQFTQPRLRRREILSLTENPCRTFLKLTFLHELGHHVYPVHGLDGDPWLSEAFANWFVYGFLNPRERALLRAKTCLQCSEYQAFEGFLSFLDVPGLPDPWQVLSPWTLLGGEEWVRTLERAAFEGTLGSIQRMGPKWLEFIKLVESTLNQALHRGFWSANRTDRCLSPATAASWVTLGLALSPSGWDLVQVLRDCELRYTGTFHFMDRDSYEEWLARMWQKPRARG